MSSTHAKSVPCMHAWCATVLFCCRSGSAPNSGAAVARHSRHTEAIAAFLIFLRGQSVASALPGEVAGVLETCRSHAQCPCKKLRIFVLCHLFPWLTSHAGLSPPRCPSQQWPEMLGLTSPCPWQSWSRYSSGTPPPVLGFKLPQSLSLDNSKQRKPK